MVRLAIKVALRTPTEPGVRAYPLKEGADAIPYGEPVDGPPDERVDRVLELARNQNDY